MSALLLRVLAVEMRYPVSQYTVQSMGIFILAVAGITPPGYLAANYIIWMLGCTVMLIARKYTKGVFFSETEARRLVAIPSPVRLVIHHASLLALKMFTVIPITRAETVIMFCATAIWMIVWEVALFHSMCYHRLFDERNEL